MNLCKYVFCSVYRQYLIHNNKNLSNDRVKFDDYQYSNVEEKIISNQSSQSKLIDTWVILLILYNTSDSSTFFSRESLVKMTPSKMNCFELNDSKQNKVRQLNYQM
jgi:hypothetical protein